jgi:hypothetical protein
MRSDECGETGYPKRVNATGLPSKPENEARKINITCPLVGVEPRTRDILETLLVIAEPRASKDVMNSPPFFHVDF